MSDTNTITFRNYIMDYIFNYAEISIVFKLIKLSKSFFKLFRVNNQIKEWLDKVIFIPKGKSIRVFNQSINLIRQLDGHTDYISCLTKLDENLIASGSDDRTVKIWNIHSGECIRTLNDYYHIVTSLTVLKNGSLASGSRDFTIKIWDKEFNCIMTLREHSHYIQCLHTMQNGWLASGSYDKRIKIFDPNDNFKCKYTLEGHNGIVFSIKQLPNNDLVSISTCTQGTIIIWSFNDKLKKVKEVETDSPCSSLCILPNNRIASGHYDNIIRIWNASTMECLSKLEGHTNWVFSLLLLINGRFVSAAYTKEVIVWKPTNDNNSFIEIKRIEDGGYFYSMIEM